MPDPTNPDEAECRYCFDTGIVPGTYDVCVNVAARLGRVVDPSAAEAGRTAHAPRTSATATTTAVRLIG